MSDTQTTIRAADLAERIVDEISQADRDWPAIELCSHELVEVIAELASGTATTIGGATSGEGYRQYLQAHACLNQRSTSC